MLYCNVQYDEIRKIKPNMNYWKTIIQKEFFNKFVLKDEQKMLFHLTIDSTTCMGTLRQGMNHRLHFQQRKAIV